MARPNRREWTITVCVECDELVNECTCDPADWVDFSGRQCHPSSVKIDVVEAAKEAGMPESCDHEYAGPDDVCWKCGDDRPREYDEETVALADALDGLHRYSLVPNHGYAGSPCEAKVRAALAAVGRIVP